MRDSPHQNANLQLHFGSGKNEGMAEPTYQLQASVFDQPVRPCYRGTMKRNGKTIELSATDLVGYLNCGHLSNLDLAVADGVLAKPHVWGDPLLEVLWERGAVHERNYVEHLKSLRLDVVGIDGIDVTSEALEQTRSAMCGGATVIVQGALSYEGWCGRIDILRRVEAPSYLGGWSYEVVDTKLARDTKVGTILQLCLYSWLLEQAQGLSSEHMYVV